MSQSSPSAQARPLFGHISPNGLWWFVSFAPNADPVMDLPVDQAWGLVSGDDRGYSAGARVYDVADATLNYGSAGNYRARQNLSGTYVKGQAGSSYNPPSESGTLDAAYGLAFEVQYSSQQLAGTYSNSGSGSTVSVTLTAVSDGLAVAGSSSGDSQMGTLSAFCGGMGAPDSRYNSWVGVLELDPSECPTSQSPDPNPDFVVMAYLLDTSDCASTTSPNTLVMGLHDGSEANPRSHYYHRLCRT